MQKVKKANCQGQTPKEQKQRSQSLKIKAKA